MGPNRASQWREASEGACVVHRFVQLAAICVGRCHRVYFTEHESGYHVRVARPPLDLARPGAAKLSGAVQLRKHASRTQCADLGAGLPWRSARGLALESIKDSLVVFLALRMRSCST